VPALLALVVREAFSPTEAGGAFIGATAWFGLTTGLRRALFSNEAGQGTSPIAHSAAKTNEPVREGVVAGLEPFIDTCLVCTLTALVILVTGTWNREAAGDFGGEIALVRAEDGIVSVEADTALENLPELPAPDVWTVGNSFFLVAEVEQTSGDTGSRLVRVPGTLVDDGEGGLVIEWGSLSGPAADGATLVSKGVYRDLVGAALTGLAYDRAIPGLGKWLVTAACWLFAISTLISWAYYGEQGIIYLFGDRAVTPYKLVFCLATVVVTLPNFIRTDTQLGNLADLGTGVMLVANVPIILAMGYQAMNAFNDYFSRMRSGTMNPPHKLPPFTDVVEGRDVD
jgi:AGCS family alanine or glycine:cation symporter